MKTVVILHGTQGSPAGNWFKWLKGELEHKGHTVWLPTLPHAEQPSLKEWVQFVTENKPFEIDNNTLIIGHSSGAILALVIAQEAQHKIGAVVAVSVFHDNSLGWEANDRLFDVDFHYDRVRTNVERLLFIHSDTDPYVPLDQARYVADSCEGELIIIKGQGHFNLERSEDYKTFPKLLEVICAKQIL